MENKELIQSYTSVFSGYKSNIYEERLITKIVEWLQSHISGERLNCQVKFKHDKLRLSVPIKELAQNDKNVKYKRIEDAIFDISRKQITRIKKLENGKKAIYSLNIVSSTGIIFGETDVDYSETGFTVRNGIAELNFTEEFIDFMLDFTCGFRRYEMMYVYKLKSSYSVKMYRMISEQKTESKYNLDWFKQMLGVDGDSYNDIRNFRRLMSRIKDEMISVKLPYLFDYSIKGNEIRIIPFENIDSVIDKSIESNREKTSSVRKYIGEATWNIFRDYKFSSSLLVRNDKLLKEFKDIPNSDSILLNIMEENKNKSTFKQIIFAKIRKAIEKHKKDEMKRMIEESNNNSGTIYV